MWSESLTNTKGRAGSLKEKDTETNKQTRTTHYDRPTKLRAGFFFFFKENGIETATTKIVARNPSATPKERTTGFSSQLAQR